MKLGTICSLLAIVSLSSIAAVGCSAESPPAADKSEVTGEQGQPAAKTDAGAPAASKNAPASTTKPGSTTTTTTDTTKPANGETSAVAVCKACLAKTTQGAELVKCANKCDDKDDACLGKCQDDVCGEDGSKCSAELAKCESECKPTEPTPEENADFAKCMAENPKTKALNECETKCNDPACGEKCWTSSQCESDEACIKQLDKCEGAGG